jgi:lysyl-tRNA synthetase class 2
MSEDRDNPLRAEKRKKLHELKTQGVNPFPYSFERTLNSVQAKEKYSHLQNGENDQAHKHQMAGRVLTKRPMGKAAFFTFQDQEGSFQAYIRVQELSEQDKIAFDYLDIGDIVGLSGFIFRTQKGEISIHCEKFQILCKTLEPLPEKYHGLTDTELKYRYRHLDLIMNPETRKVFQARTKVMKYIRNFLDNRGFLEVETPILQPMYGGAAATPFTTHHKVLDMKLYMKISPELYLKKLIVGGFDKVYDMNKNFRNEGIDRSHNPEFTMIEWYEAYTDYNYQMKQFEELYSGAIKEVTGSYKVVFQEKEIDFTPPWRRLSMHDAIKEYGNIDVEKLDEKQLFDELKKHGSELKKPGAFGSMVAELFELVAEKHLWQPTFIIDHPIEISPLTKNHRTKKGLVERFEPFAACMELGNAYSELNDPEEQRKRLKEQEAQRAENAEAHPMDEDFLHAIDVGMPPTGGVGLGVDRLVMLATNNSSIRDIILFPTMKIKND